jgi:hypothetical protein
VNFGASLEKNISVPKSTGYRMMSSLEYAKWLAKDQPKGDKSVNVLAVLQDAQAGGALDRAKAAVVAKLDVLMAAKRARHTQVANRAIVALGVLALAGAGWHYYTIQLAAASRDAAGGEL